MGKRDYALRLGETNGVGVQAVGVLVITPLAVEAVRTNRTLPDSVGGVELFTKAAPVWKWEGLSGAAGWHFFVVILGHGEPPETVVAGVFYGRSYGHSPSAYFFWSVVVRNEGTVIKVRVNVGHDPGFGEAVSGLSVLNPPGRPVIG